MSGNMRLARAMARLGARASTIAQQAGIPAGAARRLYAEVNGRCSPPGQLPASMKYFAQPIPRVHASLFLCFFEPRLSRGLGLGEAATLAFADYAAVAGEAIEFDFERAFFLAKVFAAQQSRPGREIRKRPCRKCGTQYYIMHPIDASDRHICPLCSGRVQASLAIRQRFGDSLERSER